LTSGNWWERFAAERAALFRLHSHGKPNCMVMLPIVRDRERGGGAGGVFLVRAGRWPSITFWLAGSFSAAGRPAVLLASAAPELTIEAAREEKVQDARAAAVYVATRRLDLCHKWTVGTAVPGRAGPERNSPLVPSHVCGFPSIAERQQPADRDTRQAAADTSARHRQGVPFLPSGRPGPHLIAPWIPSPPSLAPRPGIENLIPSRSTHATESSSRRASCSCSRSRSRLAALAPCARPAPSATKQPSKGFVFLFTWACAGDKNLQRPRRQWATHCCGGPAGEGTFRSRARSRLSALAHSDKMASFGC